MAIRANLNGLEIIIEGESDLEMVLRVAGRLGATPVPPTASVPVQATAPATVPAGPLYDRMDRMCDRLGLPARSIMAYLARATEGVPDTMLMSLLGFTTKSALSGSIAGISKAGIAVGLVYDDIFTKELKGDTTLYALAPAMRDAVLRQEWAQAVPLRPSTFSADPDPTPHAVSLNPDTFVGNGREARLGLN